ncbi:MAG: hypothetical protein V3V55_02325 [Rhodospirillales bacterium]
MADKRSLDDLPPGVLAGRTRRIAEDILRNRISDQRGDKLSELLDKVIAGDLDRRVAALALLADSNDKVNFTPPAPLRPPHCTGAGGRAGSVLKRLALARLQPARANKNATQQGDIGMFG